MIIGAGEISSKVPAEITRSLNMMTSEEKGVVAFILGLLVVVIVGMVLLISHVEARTKRIDKTVGTRKFDPEEATREQMLKHLSIRVEAIEKRLDRN